MLYIQKPPKNMRLPTVGRLGLIYHLELRRRGRGLGLQMQKDNSQKDKKSRCLINKCLPCHADESF